jgi:hypothetical protein
LNPSTQKGTQIEWMLIGLLIREYDGLGFFFFFEKVKESFVGISHMRIHPLKRNAD